MRMSFIDASQLCVICVNKNYSHEYNPPHQPAIAPLSATVNRYWVRIASQSRSVPTVV